MIKTRKFLNDLNLSVVNKEFADLDRKIEGFGFKRCGLELSGFKSENFYPSTIVAWGRKEFLFLKSKNEEEIKNSLKNSLFKECPLLILSISFDGCDGVESNILEVANSLSIPVCFIETSLNLFHPQVTNYLVVKNAKYKSIHASLVVINGQGVMIKGESGIGKSEAVLELIHKGQRFVSDDTVEAYRVGNNLFGRPAHITKNLLESRGIGIINIPYVYGTRSTVDYAQIDLIVELMPENFKNKLDRIGDKKIYEQIEGLEIPKIKIPTGNGRSAGTLIEAATNFFMGNKNGKNSLSIINKRIKKEK